jgi:hypothetical protein
LPRFAKGSSFPPLPREALQMTAATDNSNVFDLINTVIMWFHLTHGLMSICISAARLVPGRLWASRNAIRGSDGRLDITHIYRI